VWARVRVLRHAVIRRSVKIYYATRRKRCRFAAVTRPGLCAGKFERTVVSGMGGGNVIFAENDSVPEAENYEISFSFLLFPPPHPTPTARTRTTLTRRSCPARLRFVAYTYWTVYHHGPETLANRNSDPNRRVPD